jgi:hypothetical protein
MGDLIKRTSDSWKMSVASPFLLIQFLDPPLSSYCWYYLGRSYWIGVSDILEEHRWIYSSDKGEITVNNFSPGEPTAYTTENCVALLQSKHGKWIDGACTNGFYFICEEIKE